MRPQTNLALIEQHHAEAAKLPPTLEVEVAGLRIGDFRLVMFPGELTVQIGLNIKKNARGPFSFVAGYSNGYIFYTPDLASSGATPAMRRRMATCWWRRSGRGCLKPRRPMCCGGFEAFRGQPAGNAITASWSARHPCRSGIPQECSSGPVMKATRAN